jgi:glutaredoxin 3
MLSRANGRTTVPQIFVGAVHVGGCDDLYALDASGRLDPLLAREEERA